MGGPGGGVEGEYNYYCGNLVFLFCMSFIVIQVILLLLLDGTKMLDCCEYKVGLVNCQASGQMVNEKVNIP